ATSFLVLFPSLRFVRLSPGFCFAGPKLELKNAAFWPSYTETSISGCAGAVFVTTGHSTAELSPHVAPTNSGQSSPLSPKRTRASAAIVLRT
ncbi:hypothetical protein C8R47DRAFT_1189788, partial [Mycena vitilis]